MSSYVEVRGVKIGEGVPKICVPIVGKTKEEILAAAKSFADVKMDVVEWRVDCIGLRIRLRRLTETYPSACRDICVS